MIDLINPMLRDAHKAREWLGVQRWPNGPVCPHCGNIDQDKITVLSGNAHRPDLFKCNECREQFTETVGSVMERGKIPLTKGALAMFLMTTSKKGSSTIADRRTPKTLKQKARGFLRWRKRNGR